MKKFFAIAVIFALLVSTAFATIDDLGVQVIGGSGAESVPMSLDDLQLGQKYTIDGYAIIAPVEFLIVDSFAQFNKDADYFNVGGSNSDINGRVFVDKLDSNFFYNWRWWDAGWKDSGTNADFVWLMMDITNLQKKPFDFMQDVSVKVIYQDEYEFAGWVRQLNYDYLQQGSQGRDVSRVNYDRVVPNVVVMDPANMEEIDMMYTGTYVYGATLPNSVFEDTKSPLQMIITIDGNELTYNIRK